jgi:hypothetical protein
MFFVNPYREQLLDWQVLGINRKEREGRKVNAKKKRKEIAEEYMRLNRKKLHTNKPIN